MQPLFYKNNQRLLSFPSGNENLNSYLTCERLYRQFTLLLSRKHRKELTRMHFSLLRLDLWTKAVKRWNKDQMRSSSCISCNMTECISNSTNITESAHTAHCNQYSWSKQNNMLVVGIPFVIGFSICQHSDFQKKERVHFVNDLFTLTTRTIFGEMSFP